MVFLHNEDTREVLWWTKRLSTETIYSWLPTFSPPNKVCDIRSNTEIFPTYGLLDCSRLPIRPRDSLVGYVIYLLNEVCPSIPRYGRTDFVLWWLGAGRLMEGLPNGSDSGCKTRNKEDAKTRWKVVMFWRAFPLDGFAQGNYLSRVPVLLNV